MKALAQHVLSMLSGVDNTTIDIGRVCLLIGVVVFCYLAIGNLPKFDPQTFGVGFGALVGGSLGGLALKSKTEPTPKSE